MNVLGIPGSLRGQSHNRLLLESANSLVSNGLKLSIFDDLGELPLFDEDLEENTGGDGNAYVVALRNRISQADGLIFATPEYNQSLPGVLKNGIDWISRTDILSGKPVAILGATTGRWGTRYAQKELRHVLGSALGCRVMPSPQLYFAEADNLFDDHGEILDQRTQKSLQNLLDAFSKWI